MQVRQARLEDYENLLPLFAEVDAHHRVQLPFLFKQPDGPARDRAYLLGVLTDEQSHLLVGELDGALVGLIVVIIKETPDFPILVRRRFAMIDNIVVRADVRQTGIGKKLMQAAHDLARAQGATSVELNVFAFNQDAVRFYEELGYEVLSYKMNKHL